MASLWGLGQEELTLDCLRRTKTNSVNLLWHCSWCWGYIHEQVESMPPQGLHSSGEDRQWASTYITSQRVVNAGWGWELDGLVREELKKVWECGNVDIMAEGKASSKGLCPEARLCPVYLRKSKEDSVAEAYRVGVKMRSERNKGQIM